MTWITADVGHIHIGFFHIEKQIFWVLHPHDMVVDVAMDGPQRLKIGQSFGGLDATDVTSMPQLIDILEEVEKLWHEGTMCIG